MQTVLPKWTRLREGFPLPPDLVQWNQEFDPPTRGTRVAIHAWGEPVGGVVEGYEPTHGWLMIWVRPDVRPEWHKRDMPDRSVCLFAGVELEIK